MSVFFFAADFPLGCNGKKNPHWLIECCQSTALSCGRGVRVGACCWVMGHKLSSTGLCTGGRVQCVWCGAFPISMVGDRADTILSPKECAVHEELKDRQ